MSQSIKYAQSETPSALTVTLPRSKSISHRHLFLHFLHPDSGVLQSVSESRDTKIFQAALVSTAQIIDFQDAGTPSRFALVYFSVTNRPKTLTGNASLKKRSIADLVYTLQEQGAKIEYLETPGFFPVTLHQGITQSKPFWEIKTQESSQFVSALMLGITTLKPIPKIRVADLTHSWSYIHLTKSVLQHWGFTVSIDRSEICIGGSPKTAVPIEVEIDWGSASFVYLLALFTKKTFRIIGAKRNSLQSDFQAVAIFEQLGVSTEFDTSDAIIRPHSKTTPPSEFDGSQCIDLIPALASAYAYLQEDVTFYGIEKLAVKESNRLEGIARHLNQLGFSWRTQEGGFRLGCQTAELPNAFNILTQHDHRMAMAFAPWAAVIPQVRIDDTECTEKSFPGYWELLKMCNFELQPH